MHATAPPPPQQQRGPVLQSPEPPGTGGSRAHRPTVYTATCLEPQSRPSPAIRSGLKLDSPQCRNSSLRNEVRAARAQTCSVVPPRPASTSCRSISSSSRWNLRKAFANRSTRSAEAYCRPANAALSCFLHPSDAPLRKQSRDPLLEGLHASAASLRTDVADVAAPSQRRSVPARTAAASTCNCAGGCTHNRSRWRSPSLGDGLAAPAAHSTACPMPSCWHCRSAHADQPASIHSRPGRCGVEAVLRVRSAAGTATVLRARNGAVLMPILWTPIHAAGQTMRSTQ